MVEANLKIIEELKIFLETVSNDADIRKLVTKSEVDFTRDRKLTMERIVVLIINMPKRSLSMQIQDILNDITVWGDIRPIKESEQAIIAEQAGNLYEDSLTLFDRGYPSYALMYLLMNEETPRHFVMRCKVGFNKEVKQFVHSRK